MIGELLIASALLGGSTSKGKTKPKPKSSLSVGSNEKRKYKAELSRKQALLDEEIIKHKAKSKGLL